MCHVDSQFSSHLIDALVDLRLSPTDDQLRKLHGHYNAMIEANRSFNLTRITDPKEAAIKHYADSLALLPWADGVGEKIDSVLDVGTGAGFPAFPLAVLRPQWSVTAIDATRKKTDFVARTAASLGVENLRCEHAHSEHWKAFPEGGRPSANQYHLVVFRALSKPAKAIQQAGRFGPLRDPQRGPAGGGGEHATPGQCRDPETGFRPIRHDPGDSAASPCPSDHRGPGQAELAGPGFLHPEEDRPERSVLPVLQVPDDAGRRR